MNYQRNSKPWLNTIFAQFQHSDLEHELKRLAKVLQCKIVWGENESPDIIALGNFVSIVDRDSIGVSNWELFLKYRMESDDSTPCIIIDKITTFEIPKLAGLLYIDISQKGSIQKILALVTAIKVQSRQT